MGGARHRACKCRAGVSPGVKPNGRVKRGGGKSPAWVQGLKHEDPVSADC